MTGGAIKLDDAALDGAARKLRAIKGSLAGVEGRLTPSLAHGAPPALAGAITSDVAAIRRDVDQIGASAVRQAEELTRRAALARIADGRGTGKDFGVLVGILSGATKAEKARRPDLFKTIEGILGDETLRDSVEEGLERAAKIWQRYTVVRNPGVAAAGVSRLAAYLTGRTHWRDVGREIASHANAVKWLERGGKTLKVVSLATDAIEIATAKGPVEQNEAIGDAAGGLAGGWAGAEAGAALGAFGGPPGILVGGIVGGVVGGIAGSGAGKWLGHQLGKTGVGKAIGKGIDGAKHAISDAGNAVKKVWKSLW